MQYSLLKTFSKNLGDDIQVISAKQFLPRVDYYVEREKMFRCLYKPESFLLANGWFMHMPRNFPPPENIKPFYISVHFSNKEIFTDLTIKHLKRFAPIGARDDFTLGLLNAHGIPAYFSGDLTLTLKNNFNFRTQDIYIVDLHEEYLSAIPENIKSRALQLTQSTMVGFKDYYSGIGVWKPGLIRGYTERLIDMGMKVLLRYGAGFNRSLIKRIEGKEDELVLLRLKMAKELIDVYSQAKLVITSRLHCALPCLALQTPVVMFGDSKDPRLSVLNKRYRLNIYSHRDKALINWSPDLLDVSGYAKSLSALCRKAVEIQGNPLKDQPLDDFFR